MKTRIYATPAVKGLIILYVILMLLFFGEFPLCCDIRLIDVMQIKITIMYIVYPFSAGTDFRRQNQM